MNRLKSIGKVVVPHALALVLLAGTAAAAITLTYNATSSQGLGVKAVPVVYGAGADSALSNYVTAFTLSANRTSFSTVVRFTLSANRTSFSTVVRGVPESTVVLGELVSLTNADARARNVTLTATPNANPLVLAYRVEWLQGSSVVGTLDLKAAAPSVTFASMPAGQTYVARVVVSLAGGAGAHNVADAPVVITTLVQP